MNRKPFEEITRKALPFSRRWIAGGALGAALAGTSGLLATKEAGAGKKGKKKMSQMQGWRSLPEGSLSLPEERARARGVSTGRRPAVVHACRGEPQGLLPRKPDLRRL